MYQSIRGTLPLGLLGLVFVTTLFLCIPLNLVPTEIDNTEAIIAPLRDAVYSHSHTEPQIRYLHRTTLERIGLENLTDIQRARGEALTHYYLGRYYQAVKTRGEMAAYAGDLRNKKYLALRKYYDNRTAALEAYENSKAASEIYLELTGDAESHRLYGEILGQMLFLGSGIQALAIGPKARRHVKTALELDPGLIKARIQEASRLAYSPGNYGGDPEGARDLYRDILRSGSADREDLFNIYGGFAMAAFMEGKDDEAISWFMEASLVYPGNVFAAGMTDYLEGADF